MRLIGKCWGVSEEGINENGKAFDLPVRNQSMYRYYVCTLDKRDIHVLARALPLKFNQISSYYCLL